MVLNTKIAFRVFLFILIILFALAAYFIFYTSSDNGIEGVLRSIGFESADGSKDNPAVPITNGSNSFETNSNGGGNSGSNNAQVIRFCTFEADHVVNGDTPCRCGLNAVCTENGQICDATFNNGQGLCQ